MDDANKILREISEAVAEQTRVMVVPIDAIARRVLGFQVSKVKGDTAPMSSTQIFTLVRDLFLLDQQMAGQDAEARCDCETCQHLAAINKATEEYLTRELDKIIAKREGQSVAKDN